MANKCKNCGKEEKEHYVSIDSDRKKMLKNVIRWCYSTSKVKPTDERYLMKFVEVSNDEVKE